MTSSTLRAGIYCRLSLAVMGDTTHVDDQEKVCRRILPRDVIVAYQHVYKDNSKSAWRRDRRRPGWDTMLQAVAAGELDIVAVYHGDRLVRQPRDLEDLIDVGADRGITLISPTGTYNLADPDHQMMLRWMVARAKNEIDNMSRRFKDGHRRRREQGLVRSGGRGGRPFGFESDSVTHREAEVTLIRECAERILAGEGVSTIARDWNGRGLKTVTGVNWSHGTIKKMMLRPRLAGLMPDGESRGAWEPVLDDDVDRARELWEAVRAVLSRRSAEFTHATNARTHLLSRIPICGPCGNPQEIRHNSKNKDLIGYGCTTKGCRKTHRSQEYLDGYVIGHVLELLNSPSFLSELQAPADKGLAAEIAGLEARKAETEKKFEELADDPSLKPELLARSLARFDERIRGLRQRIAVSARRRLLLEYAGLDEAGWELLPLGTRRALVRATYRVVIWPVLKKGPGFETETIELVPVTEEDGEVGSAVRRWASGGCPPADRSTQPERR